MGNWVDCRHRFFLEGCPSGLRSTLGKRVYVNRVPWVRIPPLPYPNLNLDLDLNLLHVHGALST